MKICDLFDVQYGINLELVNCQLTTTDDPEGVNFVARTANNNGVVARVKTIDGKTPHPAGVLTCAGGGSVCSTFVQKEPFYSGRDLYVLTPKSNLTLNEKLYYCMCIQNNAYRYSYGRQANKTLRDIDVPDVAPEWVNNAKIAPITTRNATMTMLPQKLWAEYRMGDLFRFVKGRRLTKADMIDGNINYLGAISENNGVRQHIQVEPKDISEPNCITVNYNGSVGEAFYQSEPFWASDDVNILYADGWQMNKYNALFIVTVIKANRYRFSYGRKWTLEKMKDTVLKLPCTGDGEPDFAYMEAYIKSLPYGDRI